jgi:hypothetical protein
MALKFLLREDMPSGFNENQRYPELPAAVDFLRQYNGREFGSRSEFEKELTKFPDYLKTHRVPMSDDELLRDGLLAEKADGIIEVYNISTRSDTPAGSCWFGSLGTEEALRKYFQFQRQARFREIVENDDTP